jgi:hypothetical protein
MTPNGDVSSDTYEIVGPADRKNCVFVSATDGANKGKQLRVHKERILPENALGKSVAVVIGGKLKTVCPTCSRFLIVDKNIAECPVHGRIKITSHEHLNNPDSTSIVQQETKMSKTDTITMVDFTVVAQYGELWTKQQLKFSDPHTDVQSHVLLADNPSRKLCFNTYNGALGKKKSNTDEVFISQLEAFKNNVAPAVSGASVYSLKGTLDDARKRLEKSGYAKK